MSEPSSITSDLEATLEKSVCLYQDMGFSAQRIAAQLIRSGYPRELVRRRFPHVEERQLPPSLERSVGRRRSLGRALADNQQEREPLPTCPAGETAQAVLGKMTAVATAAASIEHATQGSSSIVESEGVSFQYVPLIQCSFPHADPGEQTTFTRRNGWLELTFSSARAGTGLPYGVPARLLTIYCASEAVRTRSPEVVLGSSVHEFLRRLDVPITRGERGSLRVYANQLLRLIHCAISIDEDIRDGAGRTGLHIRQALFVEEARLWWDEATGVGRGSSLILSPVLFQSILERSAPLSTAAIRQLRKSPMDLDVYSWLVHRLFRLTRPNTVTWDQLSGQIGHSYALPRKFRHFFVDSLKRVLSVYPEARVKVTESGLVLAPSPPHVARLSAR